MILILFAFLALVFYILFAIGIEILLYFLKIKEEVDFKKVIKQSVKWLPLNLIFVMFLEVHKYPFGLILVINNRIRNHGII